MRITDKSFKCDCKYHTKRKGSACKHMLTIEILMLQEIETPESLQHYTRKGGTALNVSLDISKRMERAIAKSVVLLNDTNVLNRNATAFHRQARSQV